MARSNGVVRVIGALWSAQHMLPPCANLCASRNRDHGGRNRAVQARVARDVSALDVLDRVVGVGRADAIELALVGAVDR